MGVDTSNRKWLKTESFTQILNEIKSIYVIAKIYTSFQNNLGK